jgi:hypothetical protein
MKQGHNGYTLFLTLSLTLVVGTDVDPLGLNPIIRLGDIMATKTLRGERITRKNKANWQLVGPNKKKHLNASLLKVIYVGGERIAIFRLSEK